MLEFNEFKNISSTQWRFKGKLGKKNFKVGEGDYYVKETKVLFLKAYVNFNYLLWIQFFNSVCLFNLMSDFIQTNAIMLLWFQQPFTCMTPPLQLSFQSLIAGSLASLNPDILFPKPVMKLPVNATIVPDRHWIVSKYWLWDLSRFWKYFS